MVKNENQEMLFCFFLAVITVLTLSAHVWAAELKSSDAAGHGDSCGAVSPRIGCTVCKRGALKQNCEKQRYWDHSTVHDSGGKRCIVTYFRSGGHYRCDTCGATRPLDYADEFGGEHLCAVNHSSCGLGDRSVCFLGAQLPPEPFPYNQETTDE